MFVNFKLEIVTRPAFSDSLLLPFPPTPSLSTNTASFSKPTITLDSGPRFDLILIFKVLPVSFYKLKFVVLNGIG